MLRDTDTRQNLAHLTARIERLDAENTKLSSELTETLFRQVLIEEQLHLVETFVKFALASALVGIWFESGRAGVVLLVAGALPLFRRSRTMAKLEDKAADGGAELLAQGTAERSLRHLSTILFDAEEEQESVDQREVVPSVSSWPHRPIFLCDDKDGAPPLSLGTPFEIESDLFKGKMLVRLKGVPSDDPVADQKYFSGRQRRFQAIVQGRFKREVRVSEVSGCEERSDEELKSRVYGMSETERMSDYA